MEKRKSKSLTGDYIFDLSHDDFNRELLKQNPNTAVVDPDLLKDYIPEMPEEDCGNFRGNS